MLTLARKQVLRRAHMAQSGHLRHGNNLRKKLRETNLSSKSAGGGSRDSSTRSSWLSSFSSCRILKSPDGLFFMLPVKPCPFDMLMVGLQHEKREVTAKNSRTSVHGMNFKECQEYGNNRAKCSDTLSTLCNTASMSTT